MNHSYSQPLYTGNVARDLAAQPGFRTTMFLLLHIPLALLMDRFEIIATLHALAILCIGVWWALTPNQLQRVVYIVIYVVGAEVLWRMTGAKILWEYGKYASILICIVSMWRRRRLGGPRMIMVYFLLLLPSTIFTLTQMSFNDARQQISFNLSGSLSLLVSSWFFSQIQLTRKQISSLFMVLLGPIFGIVTIALSSMLTAREIHFVNASNFVTSGGFGPNQVSAVLGLGALFCFWCVLDEGASKVRQLLISAVLLVLAAQSALTFSRGGLYVAGGSVLLALFYLMRDTRTRFRLVLFGILLAFAVNKLVIPQLNQFTHGALAQRFENTSLTARDTLFVTDLKIWRDNVILGVGPGGARIFQTQAYLGHALSEDEGVASHTEFARLLAEHGVFGLLAIMLLALMGIQNVIRQPTAKTKALSVSFIAWGLLYMLQSGMRIAAPSVMFGLSFVHFESEEQQ